MTSGVTVVTPPAAEVLTLDEARSWVRQDSTDDDAILLDLIRGVREELEYRWLRTFVTTELEEVYDTFPAYGQVLTLTYAPVQAITSLQYRDPSGAWQTWPSDQYVLDNAREPCRISPGYTLFWPIVVLQPIGAVKVRYTAGYGTPDQVPRAIKSACRMLLDQRYEARKPTQESSPAVRAASVPIGWTLDQLDVLWRNPHPMVA